MPGVATSPLPVEMLDITGFHSAIVSPAGLVGVGFVDLSVAARGWPLTISRAYAPGAPDTGLGPDWAWSLGLRYERNADTGTIFLLESDGANSAYARLSGTEYEAVSGRFDSRVYNQPDGGVRRVFSDGSAELFDAAGQLTRRFGVDGAGYELKRNEAGQVIALLHEDGQKLDIEWAEGRVSRIEDEVGRILSFQYENGRLSQTSDALGRQTRQEYDANGRLAGMTFVDGSRLRIEYDVNGRVSRLTGPGNLDSRLDHWGDVESGRLTQTLVDAMGRSFRLEIVRDIAEPNHFSVVTTDPAGEQTVRDIRDGQIDVSRNGTWIGAIINDSSGSPVALVQPKGMTVLPDPNASGFPPAMDYPDARGLPQLVADPDGNNYWRGYDAAGRVVASAGESGAVERFTYDAGNRLLKYDDGTGGLYRYRYDPADRLIGWSGPGGPGGEYRYNALGQVIEMSGEGLPVQTLEYDATGQLLSLDDGETGYTVAYDPSGRTLGFKSPDGQGISVSYDQAGRLQAFTNEDGLAVEFAANGEMLIADDRGRVRGMVTNEDGSVTYLEPNGARTVVAALENGERLVTMVDADGYGWRERLDFEDRLLAAETVGGPPFVIETDENGRLIRLGDPLQPGTVETDEKGLVTSTTDAIGVRTEFIHDEKGRLTSAASPYIAIGLRYGESDAPTAIFTSDGMEIKQQLDERGRPIVYEYSGHLGNSLREEMSYDENDRLTRRSRNGLTEDFRYLGENVTETTLSTADSKLTWRDEYDPDTRTRTITMPDGDRDVTVYNAAGYAVSRETPTLSRSFEYDGEGQLTSITSNGHTYRTDGEDGHWRIAGEEEIGEDEDGVVLVETATDANGNEWKTGYDYKDVALRVENPLGEVTRVTRNTLGQITSVTDPAGRAFYADYDDLGRMVESGVVGGWAKAVEWERTYPLATTGSGGDRIYVDMVEPRVAAAYANGAETARYSFTQEGRLALGANASGEVSIDYLPDGRVSAVTDIFGRTVSYRYDNLGRRSAIRLPEGDEVGFAYPDGASISQIGPDGGKTLTRFRRDESAFEILSPDGASAKLSIGKYNGLAGIEVRSSADASTASLSVTRDGNGKVAIVEANGVETRVERDALGRMAAVTVGDDETQRWTFDASGNILTAPNGREREYDQAYRQTRFGAAQPAYDADGRLTKMGGTSLQYDAAGRLVSFETSAGQSSLRYDAFGRLVERRMPDRVEQYLYDGDSLIAVYDGNGQRLALLERNAALPRAVRLHSADGTTTLLPNHLGTPRISVSDGVVQTLAPYGAWGEIPAETPAFADWVGYTGHMQDAANGLVLMQHRTYMPATQRFTSPDPLGIDNPVNPYAYANLDPVTLIDAKGGNAGIPGFGPDLFSPQNLGGSYGLPNVNLAPGASQGDFDALVRNMRNIASNTGNSPAARRVANETLSVLHNQGVTTTLDPTMSGYGRAGGSAGNYHVQVNPDLSSTLDTGNRYGGNPALWDDSLVQHPVRRSPRGIAAAVAHESGHILQRAYQEATGQPIGRTLRELDTMMRGDVTQRALGGYPRNMTLRQSVQEALDYALHTQYGAYRRGANYFKGTSTPFASITQVNERSVVRWVQAYHPEMKAHDILDEFARAHRRVGGQYADVLAKSPALRSRVGDMIRRAEALRDLTRPRPGANATPHVDTPQVTRRTAGRTAAASGATPSRPPGPSTGPHPGAGTPPQQPAAGRTARVSAPEARPSGQRAGARPESTRPATQRPTRGPNAADPRPAGHRTQRLSQVANAVDQTPTRSRPPATRPPRAANSRPPVEPDSRPPRPASDTPKPPRTRPTIKRPTPSAPGPVRKLPDPPRISKTDIPPRPGIDAPRPPRPSAQGGRYPVVDLDTPGSRPPKPPRPNPGAGSKPPKLPAGASGGAVRPSGGRLALHGLAGALEIGMMAYDTYEYLEGRKTTYDYVTGMALNGFSMLLPHPISTAFMAHQLGALAGSYLAGQVLDAYNKGDPVARALVNWMRKSGWLNANDPTFIAVSEAFPPSLSAGQWTVDQGTQSPIIVSLWSDGPDRAALGLFDSSGAAVMDDLPLELLLGLNQAVLPAETVAALSPGQYSLYVLQPDGARKPALRFDVAPRQQEAENETSPAADADDPQTDKPPLFAVDVELRETRLAPAQLPWERFDRPDALIGANLPDGAKSYGDWQWLDDQGITGGRAHSAPKGGRPIHYVLFASGVGVTVGDNIVQYLWIDPDDRPEQIVIQIYDETLSGRHRFSFGSDTLPVDGKSGYGLIEAGAVPTAGRWLRLRLPVTDIGMDGRKIRGIGFQTDGGRVLFGPTRLSGIEDRSPMIVDAAGRDYGGAPQSDLMIHGFAMEPGKLTLAIVKGDGARLPLFSGTTGIGPRQFWWQGDATRLRGASVEATFTSSGGEVTSLRKPISGNAGLVAKILYPPHGAVVRQTVPLFGQAGGTEFDHYIVDLRPSGAGDDSWFELKRGDSPTIMTLSEVRDRIDRILSQELRSTVHGNLASLKTGSALHRFEFAEESEVLASGWLDLRLRTFDTAGNFQTDGTTLRVGEVATGQARSNIVSPDGKAALLIPPLSLPAGMGTLSIDLDNQDLPTGAPAAESGIYSMAPAGLLLAAPVEIAITSETGNSIVVVDRSGDFKAVPTRRDGAMLKAAVRDAPVGTRFYAADTVPPVLRKDLREIVNAPWLADAPEPGLVAARVQPPAGEALIEGPVPLERRLALVMSLTARDLDQIGLLIRYDNDAVLLPLAKEIAGLDERLALPGLGLAAAEASQPIFLPLRNLLPESAKQLDSIEIIQITSAAWRTFASRPVTASQITVHTVALGTIRPGQQEATWVAPANWREAGETDYRQGPIRFDTSGWRWITLEGEQAEPAWPILIDEAPPQISGLSPEAGGETGDLVVRAQITDSGSGVDWRSIRLSVNDIDVPSDMISFDRLTGQLEAAIGDLAGVAISHGADVTARLEVADLFGVAAAPAKWSWRHKSEALAFGNLRQITVEGGAQPSWTADGKGFVFASEVDGQADLFQMELESGEIVRLTETRENETSPSAGPGGVVAYVAGGELRVLEAGESRLLAANVVDPSWTGDSSIIGGSGNQVVRIAPDGSVETLCTATKGATVLNPRSVGAAIVFTQQIYHRTVWLCDPEAGTVQPLSRRPDSPATRDVDATGAGSGAFIYARGDGMSGLWRRAFGAQRESLLLPGTGAFDRRPILSPDGGTLLFDSDRTGRREIWLLELHGDMRLSLARSPVSGRAGEAIDVEFESTSKPEVWRVLDVEGKSVEDSLPMEIAGDTFLWRPATDLAEGEFQLEATLVTGLALRTELIVDRTPPEIGVKRVSDGKAIQDIEIIGELDRFVLTVEDQDRSASLSLAGGLQIGSGQPFDPAILPERIVVVTATDAAGNATTARIDLALGMTKEGRFKLGVKLPADDPGPAIETGKDSETASLSAWHYGVIVLVFLLLAGAGGALTWRRRQRTEAES